MKKLFLTFGFFLIGLIFFGSTFADFSDISNHKYRESIEYIAAHGIVQGYSDGTFGPDREIKRSEILKIILKSSIGDKIGTGTNCFSDVQNQRYSSFICHAKQHGIVKGYPDGTFRPDNSVTNAAALKMSLESFGFHEPAQLGDRRYEGYLNFVHDNNIFSKYGIRPDKNMTRAEMAYLTHQLMLEKEGLLIFDGIRKVKTAGCGNPEPITAPTSLWVRGQQRNFITAIGENYNPNQPTKLVIAFHGRTNSNEQVRGYYKVEKASQGNAIFVYPSGLPENSSPRNRRSNGDAADNLRDFELFDKIVEEFSNNYCINQDQIFVIGHSLGAWFSNSLACARGDVIRAIGTVGGSTTKNDCTGPTAAVIMHHPDDNLASFAGGVTARDQLIRQNGCNLETVPTGPAGGNCVRYTNCQSDAPVIRCPHSETNTRGYYYPHTRPSFTAKLFWNFFEEQK